LSKHNHGQLVEMIQALCYDMGQEKPAMTQRRVAMELLNLLPGVMLALMGWAATVLAVESAARLTPNDRRAMIVCSWMLWMIPGIGTFVLRGLLSTDTAALVVAATTVALGLVMLAGAINRPRTRP
jgi:hypothetical protein